ncbi:hypothetical protein BDB01DRAFT_839238 [Pilobolus umbonatus]|nr:hypothetical protein BDB01DRAFT_839238 [Pilobolus umbonatus]
MSFIISIPSTTQYQHNNSQHYYEEDHIWNKWSIRRDCNGLLRDIVRDQKFRINNIYVHNTDVWTHVIEDQHLERLKIALGLVYCHGTAFVSIYMVIVSPMWTMGSVGSTPNNYHLQNQEHLPTEHMDISCEFSKCAITQPSLRVDTPEEHHKRTNLQDQFLRRDLPLRNVRPH